MLAGGGSTLSATGTIQDNDTRGVRVSPTSLTVNEGSSNTYTVQLLSEPTNTVAIDVSVTDNLDVSVDKPSLTFTTNDLEHSADSDGGGGRRTMTRRTTRPPCNTRSAAATTAT